LKILVKGAANLNKHIIIIAGLGKVGNMIARVLEAEGMEYIVIDVDESKEKKKWEK
jgi:CPA2 family monovalent cation:H+ antiporter-2